MDMTPTQHGLGLVSPPCIPQQFADVSVNHTDMVCSPHLMPSDTEKGYESDCSEHTTHTTHATKEMPDIDTPHTDTDTTYTTYNHTHNPQDYAQCQQKGLDIVRTLFDTYRTQRDTSAQNPECIEFKTSTYCLSKLVGILSDLPDTMNAYASSFEKREETRKYIESLQRTYIEDFLNNPSSQLFYIPKTNVYVVYDGEQCTLMNKHSIWHKILAELSNKSHPLFSRRYLVKKQLMSQIKQRSLLGVTPASQTIQRILGFLTPTFLENKDSAKHFLTTLGDMILKKNELIYLVDNSAKQFLDALEDAIYFYWAGSIHANEFKFKYYDHSYSNCRLLYFHKSIEQKDVWRAFLKQNILDIVMVATHYSKRYGSADDFIKTSYDDELHDHVFYLVNTDKSKLVATFVNSYIERTSPSTTTTPHATPVLAPMASPDSPAPQPSQSSQSSQTPDQTDTDTTTNTNTNTQAGMGMTIEWNRMVYLWRLFLEEQQIPSVLMMKQLKELLQLHIPTYNAEKEYFYQVSSKYLHTVQDFSRFWKEWIVVEKDAPHTSFEQLETSELLLAYNQWARLERQAGNSIAKLSEFKIQLFVTHFYQLPVYNHTIRGIACRTWNRHAHLSKLVVDIVQEYMQALSLATNATHEIEINVSYQEFYEHLSSKWKTSVPLSTSPPISIAYFRRWLLAHNQSPDKERITQNSFAQFRG